MSEQLLRELIERLTHLEEEVRHIKRLVQREQEEGGMPWWQKVTGSHKEDAVFAEIAHLGAEIRRTEDPKASKARKKQATPRKAKDRGKVKPNVRE